MIQESASFANPGGAVLYCTVPDDTVYGVPNTGVSGQRTEDGGHGWDVLYECTVQMYVL